MKWEYKFISIESKLSDKKTILKIEEDLNKLGDEEWELVNFSPVLLGASHSFIFKRPKKENIE